MRLTSADQKHVIKHPDWIITACIFALAIAVRLWLIRSPVHDYDEGVYWQSLLSMSDGFKQYSDVFVSQPPLFLDATYPFFAALGKGIVAARVSSLLGSLLAITCGTWIAYRIGGRLAGVVTAAFLSVNGFDLLQSVTLEAEALAMGLATLSVALAVEYNHRADGKNALAAFAGAAAAAAILVKLLACACVVPFAVLAFWRRDLRSVGAYALGGLLFANAILVVHVAAWPEMWSQAVRFHLDSHVVLRENRFATMLSGLHLPLVLLALLGGAIALRRRDIASLSVLAWLTLVYLSFLKITPLFAHHLDAAQVPLTVLAAYGVSNSARFMPQWTTVAIVALILGVEGWYAGPQVRVALHPAFPSRISPGAFSQAIPKGAWVITDLQGTAAQAGYKTPPGLVDTSLVRILSGNLTSEQLIHAARDPRVRAVVLGGRRFALPQLREFRTWAHATFRRTASPAILIK